MSRLRLIKVATPSAPASTKGELFYSSTLSPAALAFIDESGNISRLGGLTTKDYRLIKVTQIFQGTTSYTPTSGAQALYVECIGAGGGGGGTTTSAAAAACGGGGGGGAYSALWTTSIKAFTVAVGVGGTAGSSAGGTGGTGGDTTFDSPSICTAKGGVGGVGETAGSTAATIAGGAGGASGSGVGDIKIDGSGGGIAQRITGLIGYSGFGGASFFGAMALALSAAGAGNNGGQYGGGASGGLVLNNSTAVAGGVGGNGLIRVWEWA